MDSQQSSHGSSLPHHRLLAYQKSLQLLAAVRAAQTRDAKLRDEALRAAKGSCLNIAEGAGRVSRADTSAIPRGRADESHKMRRSSLTSPAF